MRFASRKNGMKKTLCQRRGRRGVKARNMTMRVRRPLQGAFRKKIRSYATQSMKRKKTRKANLSFSGCGRTKYDHEGQKTSTRDLQKENPIVCHSIDEAKENKKSKPFLLWLWSPVSFVSGESIHHVNGKARSMAMRVRRPLQGTFRKKIRSYATQSMKRKKTRKANLSFSGCGRTKYDHEGQKTSTRGLQKENPIVCHSIDEAKENKKSKPFLLWLWSFYVLSSKLIPLSCLPGTKYDYEGQKTSTRGLQKENPIVCHSIDEAKENKKSKPFLLWLWT
ncbi:unnamed protein product [Rangifer tarandus platyrhynchus]|uniref:Uncharacterized protein n=1 Tax=Rangifer tarandus platyrhynchus TaxID=3082113 RepID=A0ABN9A8R9_RANTA|nr:unnamed protein product [Rangifer tarandus platyrhynchus]